MTTSPKPTKDEALKLGLEALTKAEDLLHKLEIYAVSRGLPYKDLRLDKDSVFRTAITAIREALAQPAADDKAVESGGRAVWRVRYHGSPDLQGYNIYAFKNHTATNGDFVANLGENGSAAEALCSAHNTALLSADDKAGGEVVAPTEAQFVDWCERHGMQHADREAFFDAASLYLGHTRPQPQADQPAERVALMDEKPKCTCLTNQLGPDFCEVHAA